MHQVFHGLSGKVIVDVARSSFVADHFLKHPRFEQPCHQLTAANTKRMLKVLIWTRPESIDTENAEALPFPIVSLFHLHRDPSRRDERGGGKPTAFVRIILL